MAGGDLMKRFPWDTVVMILSCAGNVFIVLKSPMGFVVWTAGNIAWITHGVKVRIDGKPQRPLIVMMLVYAALNVWGLVKWVFG